MRSRPTATPSGPVCATVREALSARSDAEAAPVAASAEVVRGHLDVCPPCRRYAAGLAELDAHVRTSRAVEAPDLTSAVLTALAHDGRRSGPTTLQLRWLVATAGIVQLLLAVPVLAGLVGSDVHAGRDLGTLQVALGVGLLFAAAQPRRAVGVLPVAAVVAAGTVVVAVIDVAAGAATLGGELTHAAEVVGVLALWALARRHPPLVMPSAVATERR